MYRCYLKHFIPIILILLCSIGDSYGVIYFLSSIKPERLVEGDGSSQLVELNFEIEPSGSTLNIKVDYIPPETQPGMRKPFIEKLTIKDGMVGDMDPKPGSIRIILPKAFDKVGVYYIWAIGDDSGEEIIRSFVHESKLIQDSILSRISRFFSNLARDRSLSVPDSDQASIWIAPMPEVDQQIDEKSLRPSIKSAIMPFWSPDGTLIACSALHQGRRVIALHRFQENSEMPEMWRWISTNQGDDLYPIWSPEGNAIAFIRKIQDKSELWVLYLDENKQPQKEIKITESSSIQQIIGWDERMGILFEAGWDPEGVVKTTQLWELNVKDGKPETTPKLVPLSGPYIPLQRYLSDQRSVICAIEETISAKPLTRLYKIGEDGKETLLLEGRWFDQRPAVSSDGRWLAFDSNRVYP